MHCQSCGRELSGGLDTFGDVGAEMCQACHLALLGDYEPNAAVECTLCHAIAAYSKEDAGYPGLYHCTACGAWVDKIALAAWKFGGDIENLTP